MNILSDDAHLTRNLTVLFGFFFVLLSTLVNAVPIITSFADETKIVFYIIAVVIAIGGAQIGFDLTNRFKKSGISSGGNWGMTSLVIVVPALYVIGMGLLLELAPWWYVGGLVMFVFMFNLPHLVSTYSSKED